MQRILLTSALALGLSIGFGPVAHAKILSTGLVYDPGDAFCTVANIGTTKVQVTSVKFFDNSGSELVGFPVVLQSNCSFPNPIFPGQSCFIYATFLTPAHPNPYARCVVDTPTPGKSLRVRITNGNADDSSNGW